MSQEMFKKLEGIDTTGIAWVGRGFVKYKYCCTILLMSKLNLFLF